MRYIVIEAPSLTDEAAVNLQDFFDTLILAFTDHYQYQIERFYRESVYGTMPDTSGPTGDDLFF